MWLYFAPCRVQFLQVRHYKQKRKIPGSSLCWSFSFLGYSSCSEHQTSRNGRRIRSTLGLWSFTRDSQLDSRVWKGTMHINQPSHSHGISRHKRTYGVEQRAKDALFLLDITPSSVQLQAYPKIHKQRSSIGTFFNKNTIELVNNSKYLKKMQQHLQCFEEKQ